jgi:hypothetical protein
MLIEKDFTSGNVTLAFETGKRIELTREETREFDKRMKEIQDPTLQGE